MKSFSFPRALSLLVAGWLVCQPGAVSAAEPDDVLPDGIAASPRAGSAPAAASAPADSVQGDVGELMRRIRDEHVVELRTSYNGSYGASLLFYPQDITYYAVLFRSKHFWRVIKSQDEKRAEEIYENFVQQSARLATVEIQRAQLQAQKAFLERVTELSAVRAKRLEADLAVAHEQQSRANEHQRTVNAEAVALNAENAQAQAQLKRLQSEVRRLQQQAESGLPDGR